MDYTSLNELDFSVTDHVVSNSVLNALPMQYEQLEVTYDKINGK